MEYWQEGYLADSDGNVYGFPCGIPQMCPECGRDLRARWIDDLNCIVCSDWKAEHFRVKNCQFCEHPTHGEDNGDLCGMPMTSFDETLQVNTNQGECFCRGPAILRDSIIDPIRREAFVGME